MKTLISVVVVVLLIAVGTMAALGVDEPKNASSMLSRLKVGDAVRFDESRRGGYDLYVMTEKFVARIRAGNKSWHEVRVTEVHDEYIVVKLVENESAFSKTIAAHAIDEITVYVGEESKG